MRGQAESVKSKIKPTQSRNHMNHRARMALACILGLLLAVGAAVLAIDTHDQEALLDQPAGLTNLYRVKPDPTGSAPGAVLTDADEWVAANDHFELYLDRTAFNIKVRDLRNGYIWQGLPDKAMMQGQQISLDWRNRTASLVTGEFLSIGNTADAKITTVKGKGAEAAVFSELENGFSARINLPEADVFLDIQFELTEFGLRVTVPDDLIEETDEKKRLSSLMIMPFFGCTRSDQIPGYLFVPDGSGALLRFAAPRDYIDAFSGRVYGEDSSLDRKNTTAVSKISAIDAFNQVLTAPVFGIAHGSRQNAFAGIVTSGDCYLNLVAYPSGVLTELAWACPQFIYIEKYIQPTSKGGTSFETIQETANPVNACVEYHLLADESATYIGMARAYRRSLEASGALAGSTVDAEKDVPLRLVALMAEQQKAVIGSRLQVMTTLEDVSDWVSQLKAAGLSNMDIVLWGYEQGGVSAHRLDEQKLARGIGRQAELEELAAGLAAAGQNLMLSKEIFAGYAGQIDRSNMLYHIDSTLVEQYRPNQAIDKVLYFNNLPALNRLIDKLASQPEAMRQITLTTLPGSLLSDFRRNRSVSRDQMQTEILALLKKTADLTDYLVLDDPNAYALFAADAVSNLPVMHSQYMYETDAVPFMQIVLSGHMDYFAPNINFTTDVPDTVLRLIDFGACPSFLMTEAYSNKLVGSNLADLYSTRFADWSPIVSDSWQMINTVLGPVRGRAILDRLVPEEGHVIVKYEGGMAVLVNYTDQPWRTDGLTVDPRSARVSQEGGA